MQAPPEQAGAKRLILSGLGKETRERSSVIDMEGPSSGGPSDGPQNGTSSSPLLAPDRKVVEHPGGGEVFPALGYPATVPARVRPTAHSWSKSGQSGSLAE